ncbi:hypothetical protein [Mangrovihabitans endophyticus]|uniref:Uncharacterized protein n=1 Tax=Mangrovihabitans endophyticus TaxID=1751298 RepID=A0A8J3FPQ5_9ACTN|nr:hypothetical protein [Mangrovihabitans endophyticus]GGL01093.1 hypothetical protein GCM10012284_39540 [Mangrovihabitans endophyticus]
MNTMVRGAGRSAATLILVAGLVAVAAVAAWWQIGDQSSAGPEQNPEYAVPPPDLPAGAETAAGVACLVVVIGVLAALAWATATRAVRRRWWLVAAPAVLAGYVAGACLRVLTAGVLGANIGAGLAVVAGVPAVALLTLWSMVWAAVLATRRS